MQKEALKDFVVKLKNRRQGCENSLVTIANSPVNGDARQQDLLKAIPQAHINELDYVIPELERILAG